MADDILQANTEFGQRVIDSVDVPADEPHVDGVPLAEWAQSDIPLIADEEPIQSQVIPSEQEQAALYAKEADEFLYQTKAQTSVGPAPSVAANDAYTDTLLNQDPRSFDARMESYKEGNVEEAVIAAVSAQIKEQDLTVSGLLAPEHLATLTPDEVIAVVSTQIDRINLRNTPQSDRYFSLYATYKAGNGQASYSAYQQAVLTVNASDMRNMLDHQFKVSNGKMRKEVNDVVATLGFTSRAEMVANIATQDFIPFYSIISRQVLAVNMAKTMGVENLGFGWIFLGEARKKMRDHIINLPPEKQQAAAKAIGELVQRWRKDPVMAPLASKYNVLEQYEATFSEGVFQGTTSDDGMDRFFGNLETFLEAAFSVMMLAKVGSTMRGAFSATDHISAKQAADTAGVPHVSARMDEEFLSSELAHTFDADPDFANPTQLPRPAAFVNDTTDMPQGSKDVVVRSEQVSSEILDSTESLTGHGLTPRDKTNAVNKALNDLDISDGAHTQPRMSALDTMPNGEGYQMRVVVGETAEGGYKDLGAAMDELADIDPDMATVSIMRIGADGTLEKVFENPVDFARAITTGEVDAKTAGRILGEGVEDDTFYLSYDMDYFWHSADKATFSPESFLSGASRPWRGALSPNAKFGPDIYDNMLGAYMNEQVLIRNFNILLDPYHALGKDDKQFVQSAFEWMEDFGKNKRRAPNSTEVYAQYDEITVDQMNGLIAMRSAMDTMHEIFNRKLYREWKSVGFKTAHPVNPAMPTYHGKPMEVGEIKGSVLDPASGELVTLTRAELADLHNAGGRVIKLDMKVDVPNGTRAKTDQVLVNGDGYVLKDLSTKPVIYHPGYSMRFYDDPYYVVKKTEGVSVNGSARTGDAGTHSEAIATSGTHREAGARIRRLEKIAIDEGEEGVTYEVVRAKDINNTESTLFQKETLHREGRLFWDERNFDRLPDVNGSRAKLLDPVKSLERGIGQMARQATHEDPLRSLKKAWKNDFGYLFKGDPKLLDTFDLKELSNRLAALRRSTDITDKKAVIKAEGLINYLRLIEGTDQIIVPVLRERSISLAQWIGAKTHLNTRAAEKYAQRFDPFSIIRSAAFHAFMVFRPVRQLLLQSSQIGYLAALKPSYVATPQFFKDAFGLRRGVTALRKANFDDGYSAKRMAKAMNMTEKEYKVLVREFDRSGLIDLVDVHDFAGGSGSAARTALPKSTSTMGTVGYAARVMKDETAAFFKKWGFNLGENNNLTMTYNLALRRRMDAKGYKKVTEMTRTDWNATKIEASNLALGMVRPNNFAYQSGALGVATQFLSFTHKAALGLLFQNPALTTKQAFKIWAGGFMLYGANWFGGRDFAEEQLTLIGVSDRNLPGTEISLVDVISAGIIDTTLNLALEGIVEDHKDLDFGFLAPGIDVVRLSEMQLSAIMEQPIAKTMFGPFGNLASKFMIAANFTEKVLLGTPDIHPADKFTLAAGAMMSGIFPGFNDANKAYFAYQMNQWYTQAGEPLPLRPTLEGILIRGLMGVRTKEEMGYYRMQQAVWEDEENVRNAVQETRKYLKHLTSQLHNGQASPEVINQRIGYVINLYEEWPEGIRQHMLQQVMSTLDQNDPTDSNIYQDLIEITQNRSIDPTRINGLIDQFVDIPPEKREQLKQLNTEAHRGRINVDAEAQRSLEESQ